MFHNVKRIEKGESIMFSKLYFNIQKDLLKDSIDRDINSKYKKRRVWDSYELNGHNQYWLLTPYMGVRIPEDYLYLNLDNVFKGINDNDNKDKSTFEYDVKKLGIYDDKTNVQLTNKSIEVSRGKVNVFQTDSNEEIYIDSKLLSMFQKDKHDLSFKTNRTHTIVYIYDSSNTDDDWIIGLICCCRI